MARLREHRSNGGHPKQEHSTSLFSLALLFLRLGTTAFGGPAAHIAMMEDEVVRRRKWMTRDEFLICLAQPISSLVQTQPSWPFTSAIDRQDGRDSLLRKQLHSARDVDCHSLRVGLCPLRFASSVAGVLYGVKPVIIAIVLQALWSLGRSAIKSKFLAVVGLFAVALTLLKVHELLVLFGAGLTVALARSVAQQIKSNNGLKSLISASTFGDAFTNEQCRRRFIRIVASVSVLSESRRNTLRQWRYVLFAFIRADLVERWHWLTETQLLDAIAVGQVTPGPVFTTATFIGYVLGGTRGAIVATLGIFLPAFFFVAVSGPLVPRIRRSQLAGAFLDGVNVAALALM